MVGAHLDSVPRGPGANDNASGSAAVLELARVFSGRPEQARLSFALFGAEEDGLIGSRRHVERLGVERAREYRAMLNLDMVAVGDRFEVGSTGERSRDLARRVTDAGSALGLRLGQFDARGSSDHAPFADAGVPAVMLHWRDDPNYHKPTDTADRIDPEKLTATTRVVASTIEERDDAPDEGHHYVEVEPEQLTHHRQPQRRQLQDPDPPARLQDAPLLRQGGRQVRQVAHHEPGNHAVERPI
jgi:aminopeptidase YwaD